MSDERCPRPATADESRRASTIAARLITSCMGHDRTTVWDLETSGLGAELAAEPWLAGTVLWYTSCVAADMAIELSRLCASDIAATEEQITNTARAGIVHIFETVAGAFDA